MQTLAVLHNELLSHRAEACIERGANSTYNLISGV